jgi:AcrR family transcriptional regulator
MSATPKDRLLAKVVNVALSGGISDKSLRAIADAAGTSHRMLIHHFGSREGLLVAVIKAVEAQQRSLLIDAISASAAVAAGSAGAGAAEMRFWEQLRSPDLAAQERLFFEVYGQALQGRVWARPLLDGIVEDWVSPIAQVLERAGVAPDAARAVARLQVAAGRGLLLDVLATGDVDGVDAAARCFAEMTLAYVAASRGTRPGQAED